MPPDRKKLKKSTPSVAAFFSKKNANSAVAVSTNVEQNRESGW